MLIFIVNKQLNPIFLWAQLNNRAMYTYGYGEWAIEFEDDDPLASLLLLQYEPDTFTKISS